jgi:hypothetical protein
VENKTIDFNHGGIHTLDLSHSTFSGHNFKLSTTSDGTHTSGGTEYTTGVVATGTPGSAGAKLVYTPTVSANGNYDPLTLYYYCSNHSGMGGQINVAVVSQYLVLECVRILEPNTYTDIYNDYYLKRYATALIKRQWGANLIKFEGMVMPGGITFNGRQLFDDANEELLKLEEEARLNWEEPIDFMTG